MVCKNLDSLNLFVWRNPPAGLSLNSISTCLMASMMNMESPKTPSPGPILRASMNAACF